MSETFLVGGFVRDSILGLEPKDRDFVVVGASPEEMLARGFVQVGADFPVFLDPQTQEEHALARMERKSGAGYNGFATQIKDVTLEEDLMRRDLTVNAIAMTLDGHIIDPHGGTEDIKNKTFRHVSDAFMEDPLRVLRLARFIGRYGPDWSVDPSTQAMVKGMVSKGDVDYVTQERVWVEFNKGLMEPHPELMLEFLARTGLFERDAFKAYSGGAMPRLVELAKSASLGEDIAVRCAFAFPKLGVHANGKADRIPREVREVCLWFDRLESDNFSEYAVMPAIDRLALLTKCDAVRQKERFNLVMRAFDCHEEGISVDAFHDLELISQINRAEVIGDETNGLEIKERLHRAAVSALDRHPTITKRQSRPF